MFLLCSASRAVWAQVPRYELVLLKPPFELARPAGEFMSNNLAANSSVSHGSQKYVTLSGEVAQVEIFDSRGRRIFGFGEYFTGDAIVGASRLEWLTADTVVVQDKRANEVVFLAIKDDGIRKGRTVSLQEDPDDFCIMGGRLFEYSSVARPTVYGLDLRGRVLLKFAVGPDSPPVSPNRASMQSAKIICLPESNAVVIVPRFGKTVRSYSANGQIRWTHELSDFRPISVENDEMGGTFVSAPPGGYHTAFAAVELSPTVLAVQLGLLLPKGRASQGWNQIETRYLSVADGREHGSDTKLEEIVGIGNGLLAIRMRGVNPRIVFQKFSIREN